VFEDGLAKFLMSLSEKDVKDTLPEHDAEVSEHKRKPKQKGVKCRAGLKEAVNVKEQKNTGENIHQEKVTLEAAVHKP
ncbi:hypothetical protein QN366_23720, partial [Pseudomonas sp. CCC3.2]|uniref:hypothetical protein n=1 Tax=Pseudomonas sp. CCC3.2 TaxID=3048608 RepID=UPI002B227B4C